VDAAHDFQRLSTALAKSQLQFLDQRCSAECFDELLNGEGTALSAVFAFDTHNMR
jgi:hypothetical protein